MEMHDLLGSGEYYGDLFRHNLFFAQDVTRCEASPGGVVEGSWGRGTIISRVSEPYSDDQPYWYWVKLPNGKCVKACETEIKLDYSQMNYSPEKQLRSYEFQHPTWFLNHLKVSKNLHLVNNATYGFKVLAGCRAYLTMIAGLSPDPKKARELADSIAKAADGDPSMKAIDGLIANVQEAKLNHWRKHTHL